MRMIQLYGNGISKNIEKDTFSWESIYSKDCGKTWKYATKVEAKEKCKLNDLNNKCILNCT